MFGYAINENMNIVSLIKMVIILIIYPWLLFLSFADYYYQKLAHRKPPLLFLPSKIRVLLAFQEAYIH